MKFKSGRAALSFALLVVVLVVLAVGGIIGATITAWALGNENAALEQQLLSCADDQRSPEVWNSDTVLNAAAESACSTWRQSRPHDAAHTIAILSKGPVDGVARWALHIKCNDDLAPAAR